MAEDKRVPGSTASLEGKADECAVVSGFERALEESFGDDPTGRAEIVHFGGRHALLIGVGSYPNRQEFDPIPLEVDLLVQLESPPVPPDPAEFRRKILEALGAASVHQPALPGLDDLADQSVGAADRALLLSAAMLEGHGVDVRRLRDHIAEAMSATEVPIRALRNPGKVLGELAEKGQIARVTNHGKIVGWLMPATEAEQHLDDLLKQGRLRRGTPAPIEPIDVDGLERPLSEILTEARNGERS